LRARGKRVIVSLPFPEFDRAIPDVEMSNAVFGKLGITTSPKDLTSPLRREEVRAFATKAGADIFDPRETLCPGQKCIIQTDGISIYMDNHHLARNGARLLTANLGHVLEGDVESASTAQKTAGEYMARNTPHEPARARAETSAP
jgi:hypothetical protein